MAELIQHQITACPLCASYIEVESGYDGAYYLWSCSHAHLADPANMGIHEFLDPERRERARARLCLNRWSELWEACEYRRAELLAEDWPRRALGDAGLAPESEDRRKLTWTPADRRLRARWRELASTTKFSESMKAVYIPHIREHLNRGNVFLGAWEQELMDEHISLHEQLARQTFGGEWTVPLKRGTVEGKE